MHQSEQKNKLRLLFVLEHFHPFVGGVAVLFAELTKRLAQGGITVTVLTSRLPGTKKEEVWEGAKIIRVAVPNLAGRYWFSLLAFFPLLRLTPQYDLIHTTTYNAAFPAWLAGRIFHKPVILTVHEVWGKRWEMFGLGKLTALFYRTIENFLIRLPYQATVAVSKATAQDLIAARGNARNITVIYNGIDETLFRPSKISVAAAKKALGLSTEFLFCYYGRPGISKGVEYLVEAMLQLPQKKHVAKLLLILNRDPRARYEAIKKQIQVSKGEDKIMLRDPVERKELPRYIAACDCVVVPSLAEGFGFTAAEAAAMRKSLVVTTAGSLPEVVSGKVIFTKPADSQALALALERARAGKFKIVPPKNFSWENCTQKHLALYEGIVQ